MIVKMKRALSFSIALILGLILANGDVGTLKAEAAISADDKVAVTYDTSKYTYLGISRVKVTCYSQYGSMWSDLDKGDKLGYALIRFYYLEPKNSAGNGAYYGITGVQVSMNPCDVAGDISGMSQLAKFGIKTINSASRVCSPTSEILAIQKSASKTSGSQFTVSAGIEYNSSKGKWEPKASGSFGHSWGATTTYTYNMTNVNMTQKDDNGGVATWCYDYISKDKDKTWNAYLFSSTKVSGQVVYRLNFKPTSTTRKTEAPTKITYEIRFGAGNIVNGKVANRLGFSTNRDMCIKTGSQTISW